MMANPGIVSFRLCALTERDRVLLVSLLREHHEVHIEGAGPLAADEDALVTRLIQRLS